jgi:hypothetical protein
MGGSLEQKGETKSGRPRYAAPSFRRCCRLRSLQGLLHVRLSLRSCKPMMLLHPGASHRRDVLRQELLNFRRKINLKTAHDSYEHWREGDHDDLVLAAGLACWWITYRRGRTKLRMIR